MIVPGGKRYSYIRAALRRREASYIVTGRELFTSNGTEIEGKVYDMGRPEIRRKQPLDELQEARSYRKLRETLDRK